MKNVKNAHMGTHLLVEVYNVPFDKLNNAKELANKMVSAVTSEKYSLLTALTILFASSVALFNFSKGTLYTSTNK